MEIYTRVKSDNWALETAMDICLHFANQKDLNIWCSWLIDKSKKEGHEGIGEKKERRPI
jgi:hypothetical protein